MKSSLLVEDDIDVLNPDLTVNSGSKPIWVRGRYLHQKSYLLNKLNKLKNIDNSTESVGILHIRMSDVQALANTLRSSGYNCFILREEDSLNNTLGGIYVSTLHSAKGLEFDHVFIVGYDDFFAPGPHSLSHRDTSAHLSSHRKLLYTAITRAKRTLTITSSVNEYSHFLKEIEIDLLDIVNL
jgi:superfamily I DNA/RNA helicase